MPQTNAEIMTAEPGVWVEVDGKLVPDYDAKIVSFDEAFRRAMAWLREQEDSRSMTRR